MDEFGTTIRHSDTPSFAVAPFYYGPKQLSFSVIWCVRDLERGGVPCDVHVYITSLFTCWYIASLLLDEVHYIILCLPDEVTRDYVPSVRTSPLARACCLLPWKPYSLTLDDPIWSNVEEFICPPITVCVHCVCAYYIVSYTIHG